MEDQNPTREPIILNRQGRRKYHLIGNSPILPEKIEIEFHGETMTILKSPGQIINPKRMWKRWLKTHGK